MQSGKRHEPSYTGFSLSQKVGDGKTTISSGIGALASEAMVDHDYYLDKDVVAGMRSRGNTWHESDVAQADSSAASVPGFVIIPIRRPDCCPPRSQ